LFKFIKYYSYQSISPWSGQLHAARSEESQTFIKNTVHQHQYHHQHHDKSLTRQSMKQNRQNAPEINNRSNHLFPQRSPRVWIK